MHHCVLVSSLQVYAASHCQAAWATAALPWVPFNGTAALAPWPARVVGHEGREVKMSVWPMKGTSDPGLTEADGTKYSVGSRSEDA